MFHKELARELVEFILPIVEREGGTMSLMDVYCVFNRARGVGMYLLFIFPPDCNDLRTLDLSIDGGILIVFCDLTHRTHLPKGSEYGMRTF